MKKIITTVGTSLFTNFMDERVKNKYGRDYASISIDSAYNAIENSKASAVDIWNNEFKHYVRKIQENIVDFWFDDEFKDNRAASAEIASLLKISNGEKEKVQVHLVATDTLLSVLAAELIVTWFERHKHLASNINEVLFKRVQPDFKEQSESDHVVKDLRVYSSEEYEKGFMNLIMLMEKSVIKDNTILNITGGYKAITPVLTIYGQLQEIPLAYLYEEKNSNENKQELIKLGNLPIQFDLGYIENYVQFLIDPSSISAGKISKSLYELGLIKSEESPFELTILAQLIVNKLNSDDIPFQKTMFGYFVEYKLYEYYQKNKYSDFSKVELGYKLSDDPNQDLEDADLWFSKESSNNVISVEVKPASIKSKDLRKKIMKMLELIAKLQEATLEEFWIILYDFSSVPIEREEDWCKNLLEPIKNEWSDITFKIKKFTVNENVIDGSRNRIRHHEFMRSNISEVPDIFKT